MIITRTSPLTGNILEWDIDITQAQLNLWRAGALIQNVVPGLTSDEREFIISGCSPKDWEHFDH